MMSILVKDMLLSILHISLAMLSIIIISLLLAVNPTVSLLSLGAVAATLVDTAGFAYFWGLPMDPFLAVICSSSSIFLQQSLHLHSLQTQVLLSLTAGITVDYTTHVAHSFLVQVCIHCLTATFLISTQEGTSRPARVSASLAR